LLTKSVIAGFVGTVLANMPQPNSPLLSTAHATLEAHAVTNQAPRSRPVTQSVPKGRTTDTRRSAKAGFPPTAPSLKGSTARKKNVAQPRRRPLGAFAVRAYTYEWDDNILSRTASGAFPMVGRTVAVDPRVIPLGSKIYIEGLGERIAEDSGGKIRGKMLDLFLPSDEACRQFGVRQHQVQIVEK